MAWRINIGDGKIINFKNLDIGGPLSIKSNFSEKIPFSSNFELKSSHFDVNLSQIMGDFIVRQKNGLPSYQLASLVDDTLYNINFVV